MSCVSNPSRLSRRATRRNRHKPPFKPANTGKPGRVRPAGTH